MIENTSNTSNGTGSTEVRSSGAPDSSPSVHGGGVGGFTADQLSQMTKWSVDAGLMTAEQANASLKEQGLPPLAVPEVASNPMAAEIDRHFPPAKPNEYQIPVLEGTIPEVAAQDQLIRGWLTDARFTKEIGTSLVSEVGYVSKKYEAMKDPAQKELWAREQHGMLERVWGADTSKNIALARQLVREMEAKRPGFVQMLETSGGGSSANVIMSLYFQAKRLSDRKGT